MDASLEGLLAERCRLLAQLTGQSVGSGTAGAAVLGNRDAEERLDCASAIRSNGQKESETTMALASPVDARQFECASAVGLRLSKPFTQIYAAEQTTLDANRREELLEATRKLRQPLNDHQRNSFSGGMLNQTSVEHEEPIDESKAERESEKRLKMTEATMQRQRNRKRRREEKEAEEERKRQEFLRLYATGVRRPSSSSPFSTSASSTGSSSERRRRSRDRSRGASRRKKDRSRRRSRSTSRLRRSTEKSPSYGGGLPSTESELKREEVEGRERKCSSASTDLPPVVVVVAAPPAELPKLDGTDDEDETGLPQLACPFQPCDKLCTSEALLHIHKVWKHPYRMFKFERVKVSDAPSPCKEAATQTPTDFAADSIAAFSKLKVNLASLGLAGPSDAGETARAAAAAASYVQQGALSDGSQSPVDKLGAVYFTGSAA